MKILGIHPTYTDQRFTNSVTARYFNSLLYNTGENTLLVKMKNILDFFDSVVRKCQNIDSCVKMSENVSSIIRKFPWMVYGP